MTQDGFRVADTHNKAQMKGYLGQVVNGLMQTIPSGLTCVNETDWAQTTPVDNRIYLVFPDEQVSES